ncbi:TetR/AcrR family transcriptional regulator (plasmid) [Rhodococcus qingshengii]|uniref:TetR/AcrR family transcriptional regulator n=1 Tax=Rhodococcus TaxID=1827 RepID=UPI000F627E29|nr:MULTISPECIES: TetR/AcrR family transcriptional regulator [Rhodococcus]AZI65871.1 TetR/AcrR family transcriptional regulator [Rhodococcus sp. NJ-530]BDQ23824.1 TetR/AcrR family transcriptional regulator [Rhodococcus qingshengii]
MTKAETSSKADGKRRRLITAGLALMEELPYPEITVVMIAERAEMARSLVFYYFKDKEELFHHVVRDLLDGLRESFETNDLTVAADNTTAWLRREVGIFLDFMAAHPRAMETIVALGWQNERDRVGTTMMDFTAERVHHAFGSPDGGELLDPALHSWAYHCVDFTLRVHRTAPSADPASVISILVDQAESIFTTLATSLRNA